MTAAGDDSRPFIADSRPFIGALGVDSVFATKAATGRSYRSLATRWVMAATVIRFACVATVPLGNGEAYYYTWSRFLSWSYYDHPPLVAWMERLTSIFGASPAAIRLGPILCSAAFGLLLYRLSERLFGARAAFLSLVLVTALPVFLGSSFVLNPEAPLAPLWVGYLLALERMRERDEPLLPLLAGALLGFAFLAKYTALLLVPTTFLYLALSAPSRRWLRRPSLYAGGAIALLLAVPVLYWNAVHGWPTLRLHLVERGGMGMPVAGENTISHLVEDASTSGSSGIDRVLRTLAGQFFSYSPFFAPALVGALVGILRGARRDDRDLFLASFSWPILIVLLTAMVRLKDSEQHWTMMAFLPAAVAAGRYADEAWSRTRRWSLITASAAAGVVVSALAFVFATVHTHTDALIRFFPRQGYDPRADMTSELVGWDQVRASVERAVSGARGTVVLASNQYATCGRLFVEVGDSPSVYCPAERRSAFDDFNRREPPAGATVIVLTNDIHAGLPPTLQARACMRIEETDIERAGRVVARYFVHSCAPAGERPEERASRDPLTEVELRYGSAM